MNARLWIALHALAAVLPVAAAVAHAPDPALFGVEVAPALPPLTVESWREERAQAALQGSFEANLGFRGAMVRTDSTLQALVLGEAKPGGQVLIGAEQTLFMKDDVAHMDRRASDLPPVLAKLDTLTQLLGSVQRKLHARGKKMLVLLAPSKTALYPEQVGAAFRRGETRSDLVVHDALRAKLERNGVSFTDGSEVFTRSGAPSRDLLFPRPARHWSTLGACLVVQEALGGYTPAPSCAYEMVSGDRAVHVDYDLYRLLNLWRPSSSPSVVAELKEKGVSAPPGQGPKTVFVGTSFTWLLVEALRPFVSEPVAIYYNSTIYDASELLLKPIAPVDPTTPTWAKYVLDRDLYVIEIFEVYAQGEQMLAFLKTLDSRLD